MSLRITCPSCGTDFPVEAGLIEGDAKRLGAVLAGMDPALGRTALQYLHLFKPPKTSLRVSRAIKIVAELADLAEPGTVCADQRGGVTRPAPPPIWVAGMEQMLAQRQRLELPLSGHNYLRKVVYALADHADAHTEQAREADLRQGRRRHGPSPAREPEDRLTNELKWLRQQLECGAMDGRDYEELCAAARQRYGGQA